LIEKYESIVKEIDEMLFLREIDKKIKDHETKKKRMEIKKDLKHDLNIEKPDIKPKVITRSNQGNKEEIFEFPVKRVTRTIEVSC
jgi:hypothetical protein